MIAIKVPNPKFQLQRNSKSQAPKRVERLRAKLELGASLEPGASLELGSWCLELLIREHA
jgi:hypothetical protein